MKDVYIYFIVRQGDIESDEDSYDSSVIDSDQSDTDEEEETSVQILPVTKSVPKTNIIETVEEPEIAEKPPQNRTEVISNTSQLNSSLLYSSSLLSAQKYENVFSRSSTFTEAHKSKNIEKEVEQDIKKEFNDASKLREDQKQNMRRAKDLLKAAFSESESDPEDSEDEDKLHQKEGSSEVMSDNDIDLT